MVRYRMDSTVRYQSKRFDYYVAIRYKTVRFVLIDTIRFLKCETIRTFTVPYLSFRVQHAYRIYLLQSA